MFNLGRRWPFKRDCHNY